MSLATATDPVQPAHPSDRSAVPSTTAATSVARNDDDDDDDDNDDDDSNFDMLDDEDDNEDEQEDSVAEGEGTATATTAAEPQAGPGPSTLAYRTAADHNKKRPATSPPAPAPAPKHKHKKQKPSVARGIPPLPHFTVVRAAHNSKQSPHRICIHPGVTDADPDRWPSEPEYNPDRKVDGRPNWYERVPKDVGRHKSFRDKVGDELAKSLKLVQRSDEFWTLDALPENYLFTVHHCTGGGKPRTDVYVWGSPKALKFRTANEMTPHIHWLLVHGPDDQIACQCKYCAKTTQGDVNRQLGLPTKETGAGAGAARSASPASSVSGLRVKNRVNYAYKPSPLALESGSGPSSSAASSLYGGAAARVASFNDPGGDRLLGPNATPAAIAKAKRRHAQEMDDLAELSGHKKKTKKLKNQDKRDRKGKGKEVAAGGGGKKKKKKQRPSDESSASRVSESSAESSDVADATASESSSASDAEGSDAGAAESGGPTYRGAFTNRQRDEDLDRSSAPRRGELVWAELPRPLVGHEGSLAGQVVTHWPGIVESRDIRAEATVVVPPPPPTTTTTKADAGAGYEEEDEDARGRVESAYGAAATTTTTADQNGRGVAVGTGTGTGTGTGRAGTTLEMPPAPRLETVSSTRYTVRLFAVADTVRLLREDQVLPWLRHAPPKSLFVEFGSLLQDAERVRHIWDAKRGRFVRDAVLFQPHPRARGEGAEGERPTTLDEALAPLGLAMQIASHVLTSFTLNDRYNVTARFLTPVDPLDPMHRQEREKQLKSWAFQATHFGAELVWTGDFVRIFEADGTPFEALRYESPPTSMGKRALFMKVFAIYKDNEVGSETGVVKLAGELWELRDFATTITTATAATATAAGTVATATATVTTVAAREAYAGPSVASATAAAVDPLTTAANSVGAADGQSAMSMFEKRPSPAGLTGSATSAHQVTGTPSTPPDTPPAGGPTSASPASTARQAAVASAADALDLPSPPAGFYWFRLTSSTEQVHATLDFLAGRYHPLPRGLNSPAKIREVLDRLDRSDSDELTDDDARAMLLAGLGPAYKLFNKCGIYIGDRKTALVTATQHAESEARPILEEGTAAAAAAALLKEDVPAPTTATPNAA